MWAVRTSDYDISLLPFEIAQHGVHAVSGVGNHDALIGLCTDEVCETLPDSSEERSVFRAQELVGVGLNVARKLVACCEHRKRQGAI